MTTDGMASAIDRQTLEQVVLLHVRGDAFDHNAVAAAGGTQGTETIRHLVRLSEVGYVTGDFIEVAEETLPIRVNNIVPTAAGIAFLNS